LEDLHPISIFSLWKSFGHGTYVPSFYRNLNMSSNLILFFLTEVRYTSLCPSLLYPQYSKIRVFISCAHPKGPICQILVFWNRNPLYVTCLFCLFSIFMFSNSYIYRVLKGLGVSDYSTTKNSIYLKRKS
jgi:hypothetical protein